MPTNCLSFVDHFVESALKWLLPIFLKKCSTVLLTFWKFELFYSTVTFDFPPFLSFLFVLYCFQLLMLLFFWQLLRVTVHAIHVVLHEKANHHMVTSNGWQSRSGINFNLVKACFKNFGVTFKGELPLKFRQSHRKTGRN